MDDVTQRQYMVGNVVQGGRDTSSPPGCKKPARKKMTVKQRVKKISRPLHLTASFQEK